MKTVLIVLLAAATLGVGALYWRHTRTEAAQIAQQQAIKEELAAKEEALQEAEAARKRAEDNQEQLLALSGKLTSELKARQGSATNVAATSATGANGTTTGNGGEKNALSKLISGMMEDPSIKKMIRGQQRVMIDNMYDPLIAKMGLTAEQGGQLKDMIADNMAKAAESAGSLFGGSSSNRSDVVQQLTADRKVLDDQIRGFLGEDRYAQYHDYEETVQERAQLTSFQQQLGATGPLTDTQTEQLLGFMKEEKLTAMTSSGLMDSGGIPEEAGMRAMTSEADANKLLQAQEQASQRVYDRATGVLSPEQLAAFGKFQTNQMNMMRVGMDMARKFMNPEQSK